MDNDQNKLIGWKNSLDFFSEVGLSEEQINALFKEIGETQKREPTTDEFLYECLSLISAFVKEVYEVKKLGHEKSNQRMFILSIIPYLLNYEDVFPIRSELFGNLDLTKLVIYDIFVYQYGILIIDNGELSSLKNKEFEFDFLRNLKICTEVSENKPDIIGIPEESAETIFFAGLKTNIKFKIINRDDFILNKDNKFDSLFKGKKIWVYEKFDNYELLNDCPEYKIKPYEQSKQNNLEFSKVQKN